jgi:SAM-dependent methyltransferase
VETAQQPGFDYQEYLEAKFGIDSASLNATLHSRFRDHLRHTADPRVLDLGTGTGAMLRRIVELGLSGNMELIGLDQEEQNLVVGMNRMERSMQHLGYRIGEKQRGPGRRMIRGKRGGSVIGVEFRRIDIPDGLTARDLGRFDCVTAHAFMDLMPLRRCVAAVRRLLNPGGLFYSTLNYDGTTVLLPEYQVPGFERRLLRIYDRSMERRRSRGRRTGGSVSGRRLYGTLVREGFEILGLGTSDWSVFPQAGGYGEDHKIFLTAILSMIEGEARRERSGPKGGETEVAQPAVDLKALAEWYAHRLQAVHKDGLALVVHQLDLLARPTGGGQARTGSDR